MNNLTRYYNKNRKKIWLGILIVLFIWFIIHIINNFYKQQRNSRMNVISNEGNSTLETVKDYKNESKAMVQGSISSDSNKKEFGTIIDNFLQFCVNNQPEEAYKLISNSCKEKLYPTQRAFIANYYSTKFNKKKSYEFQLWSAVNQTYVYLVKIYDDMLSTGIASTQDYIQDYFSVIKEDNQYRINLGGYVKTVNYQRKNKQVEDIKIAVNSVDTYMDYEIYHFIVTNNTENTILLDSTLSGDTVYLKDNQQNHLNSMLIENIQEDFVIYSGESKSISIKFVSSYSTQTEIKGIYFDKIVKNYDEFLKNANDYNDTIRVSIKLNEVGDVYDE